MKATVFRFFAVIVTVQGGAVHWFPASTALLRTPSYDSAAAHSQTGNGGFSYSNVAYAPLAHQTVPIYRTYQIIPHHPSFYYPGVPSIVSYQPSYIPAYGDIPITSQAPSYYPQFIPDVYPLPSLPPQAPGVNPQNPVEVESPADNLPNEDLTQEQKADEDTVAVDSA